MSVLLRASTLADENRPGSSSLAMISSPRPELMSANINESKKLRVSAIEAIPPPTPPAPITRMFATISLVTFLVVTRV